MARPIRNFQRKQWLYITDIFLTTPLSIYFNFFPNFFFPKFEFPNLGCGLSASAAYTPVFTVSGQWERNDKDQFGGPQTTPVPTAVKTATKESGFWVTQEPVQTDALTITSPRWGCLLSLLLTNSNILQRANISKYWKFKIFINLVTLRK